MRKSVWDPAPLRSHRSLTASEGHSCDSGSHALLSLLLLAVCPPAHRILATAGVPEGAPHPGHHRPFLPLALLFAGVAVHHAGLSPCLLPRVVEFHETCYRFIRKLNKKMNFFRFKAGLSESDELRYT